MMEKYTDKLKEYLDQNPIGYAEGDSLLEQLYWCYGEANTFDSQEIKEQYRNLQCSIPEVPEERFDEILSLLVICLLCRKKRLFKLV